MVPLTLAAWWRYRGGLRAATWYEANVARLDGVVRVQARVAPKLSFDASVKKKIPSKAKGTPKASPHCPMNRGHSNPNSNERTVPVTAPTANVAAMYFDHRSASCSAAVSPRLMPR
jgi:hypothetical protein